jgi:RNA polymerase sigma-70 factor (sigma-E family)
MQRDSEFTEYVSARLPALHRAAYLLCGDSHRADDIVSATTMALYRHWRRAREADNLDAYVHRILIRKFTDERRLRWARVRLMGAVPEPAAAPPSAPEGALDAREELRTALAGLTHAQRTVLVLRFACDMSVEDVARTLRCSIGNVKSHTSRGLAALRRAMTSEPADGRV